jgi:hypothetical protein
LPIFSPLLTRSCPACMSPIGSIRYLRYRQECIVLQARPDGHRSHPCPICDCYSACIHSYISLGARAPSRSKKRFKTRSLRPFFLAEHCALSIVKKSSKHARAASRNILPLVPQQRELCIGRGLAARNSVKATEGQPELNRPASLVFLVVCSPSPPSYWRQSVSVASPNS